MGKTAENALLQYEAGQNVTDMSALTDSGDHQKYTSDAELWSAKSGFAPAVRPDGVKTGGKVVPGASNDTVGVAAATVNQGGTEKSVAAATSIAVARPTTGTHIIYSIVVNGSGAFAAVAGDEGSSFSETRGGAGGPPYIPAGQIEVGQVRLSSQTAAPVKSTEIYQVVGKHLERYSYPLWKELNNEGAVEFVAALPLIHTGDTPKGVYASYAEPIFADLDETAGFVPPEKSYSVSSQPIYGGVLGSRSSSLGQGSFTAYLSSGVADAVVAEKGQNLWFKFFPDRYALDHLLCQGVLGISRQYPADGNMVANCTISATEEGQEVTA
ncbi:hypothetical protein PCS_02625 [Desulfocurvibacter africanus PCS]|uniref:Uncharacterized protein n=1 Tax=Desulfocurvibacter africanus PCS TaxID=1262666 RepID=M5Q1J7_DESAF|nr:hypothetical protein [Desulfocurvibacter africanus]EMG36613.1 hypothetical protein PCS_02625 [Desulfocurvibacter africanus PCS]